MSPLSDRYQNYVEKYGANDAPAAMVRWLGMADNSDNEVYQSLRFQLLNQIGEREVAVFANRKDDDVNEIREDWNNRIFNTVQIVGFGLLMADAPEAE